MTVPRWRYVIPNLVTCLSLLAGLFSITLAFEGEFRSAAWLIVLSVLLDKMDGTAARLLKSSSRFGLQMDSLSDLVTFGVAPAVLVLSVLSDPRVSGPLLFYSPSVARYFLYVGTFFYVVAAALRLAKFNVVSETEGSKHFFGITTTLSGGLVATGLLVALRHGELSGLIAVFPIFMFLLGFLMVSSVALPKVSLAGPWPWKIFVLINLIAVYVCGLARLAPEYLFTVAVGYAVIGMVGAAAKGVRAPPLMLPQEAGGQALPTVPAEPRTEQD